jgi:hypothetical protein
VRNIINNGNTYTEKMVSNYNNGIIAGAVMGLFGSLGFLLSISSYNKSKSWVKGAKGEKLVSKYLNQLSKDYIILNNVTLPGRYGNIDHIVVGTTEFLLSKLNLEVPTLLTGTNGYMVVVLIQKKLIVTLENRLK